jgi:hypothetical protein
MRRRKRRAAKPEAGIAMIQRLCLFTLPLMVGAAQAQPENLPAGWRVFTSKEGAFSAALPGTPSESKQRVLTAAAALDVHLFVVDTKDDGALVVSYCDLPADDVKPGNEQKRLDLARDGAVTNARGKLQSEKGYKLDGCPGRELQIEADKGLRIRMRIIVAKQRLYQAMAMGPARFTQGKDAALFLDSLRLSK